MTSLFTNVTEAASDSFNDWEKVISFLETAEGPNGEKFNLEAPVPGVGKDLQWINTRLLTAMSLVNALAKSEIDEHAPIPTQYLSHLQTAVNALKEATHSTIEILKLIPNEVIATLAPLTWQITTNTGQTQDFATRILTLSNAIDEVLARYYPVAALVNSRSFDLFSEATNAISEKLTQARSAVSSIKRANKDATALNEAVKVIGKDNETKIGEISTAQDKATKVLEELEKTVTSVAAQTEKLKLEKEKAEKESASINSLLETANNEETGVTPVLASITQTLSNVQEEYGSITKQRKTANEEIEKSTNLLKQTQEKLSTALRDVKLEGLSRSFEIQARHNMYERFLWLFIFGISLFSLGYIAYKIDYRPFQDTNKIFEWPILLRGLPFQVPVVWLGWYAVRQMGIVSRIQRDYEYKAATAVAFEGYKKEIESIQNEQLTEKLLDTTIRNFGDNPVRLLGAEYKDKGLPLEELLSLENHERLWGRLMDLLKALKRNP